MPSVKLKKGSTLNDNGMITRIGMIRNSSTSQELAFSSQAPRWCQKP
jgi:hypothetical protein